MNSRPASLRWRVTLAFGALGAVLSLLFAWATTFITEHYENVLVDGMLVGFAGDITTRHAGQPLDPKTLPKTHTLQGYLRRSNGSGEVPAPFVDLPPGTYEPELGEDFDVRVGVFDVGDERLYLAINLDDVEPLETDLERILAAIVVFGTLIAAWLGWLFAGRTIAPVGRLASAVDALPTRAEETQLVDLVGPDELGRLAAAIDSYQARRVRAEARERAFFADASHELRTPLAVVTGAVELLREEQGLSQASRGQIERLDRGMSNLADLLEVLLIVERGNYGPKEQIDCRSWLLGSLDQIGHEVVLNIEVANDSDRMSVQSREGGLVVRGVVRQLNRSGAVAEIGIHVSGSRIIFTRTSANPSQIGSKNKSNSSDRGLGATLIGRLATQLGWTIDEGLLSEGRVTIVMSDVSEDVLSSTAACQPGV